jgi:DNA-binding NarL/FixJ family response regulator
MIEQPPLQTIRVLLIIKHDLYREALGTALHLEDPTLEIVGQCRNSLDAAEIFSRSHPTIVIMDASMRPASFAELTSQLRYMNRCAKIIAITNQYEKLRAERLIQEGAAGLLTRTMLPKSMIALIHELLPPPRECTRGNES